MILNFEEAVGAHVLSKIRAAPIEQSPFPHCVIEDIFPDDYYQELLAKIPPSSDFTRADYPGTGVGAKAQSFHNFGLAYEDISKTEAFIPLHDFLKSKVFCKTLLDKFSAVASRGSTGTAIPPFKHPLFTSGQENYTSVFDMHKDLPGYEILPHRDIPQKLVTFQFYLQSDDVLADFGTKLCAPKTSTTVAMLQQPGGDQGQYKDWHNWELFDIVRTANATPNTMLCFAPNDISYHAVKLDIPKDCHCQERTVLRGFIRAGRNAGNFIKFHDQN